ncbi:MAG TPA: hypothetical protein VGO11_00790 [Chthoniobacteraceae bacterium]|jgi:hypothetical protein|nr:hypothetical protein [Chthoniobacteraceae bacterium]
MHFDALPQEDRTLIEATERMLVESRRLLEETRASHRAYEKSMQAMREQIAGLRRDLREERQTRTPPLASGPVGGR